MTSGATATASFPGRVHGVVVQTSKYSAASSARAGAEESISIRSRVRERRGTSGNLTKIEGSETSS